MSCLLHWLRNRRSIANLIKSSLTQNWNVIWNQRVALTNNFGTTIPSGSCYILKSNFIFMKWTSEKWIIHSQLGMITSNLQHLNRCLTCPNLWYPELARVHIKAIDRVCRNLAFIILHVYLKQQNLTCYIYVYMRGLDLFYYHGKRRTAILFLIWHIRTA